MAGRRRIAVGTEPEQVEIGGVVLTFRPEADVDACEFLDANAMLITAEEGLGRTTVEVGGDTPVGRQAAAALERTEAAKRHMEATREFVAVFLTPDSRDVFARLPLPVRAVRDLIAVVSSLYGGGRPPGLSGGSPPPSSPPGTTSTAG